MKKYKHPKRISFFKPVPLWTSNNVKRVSKKDLTWPQAIIRYPNMQAFGDTDRDGVLNAWDCRPFDPLRHKRSFPSQKSINESRIKLREAGYPPEIVNRVAAWFKPKVEEFIKGRRSLRGALSWEQEAELNSIAGDPKKVKAWFEMFRKDTRIYEKSVEDRAKVNAKFRKSHIEELREAAREYGRMHKEQKKAYRQKYNEEHPEVRAKHYYSHLDEIHAQAKKFRDEHKEELKLEARQRRIDDADAIHATQKRYRQRRAAAKEILADATYEPSAQELIDTVDVTPIKMSAQELIDTTEAED